MNVETAINLSNVTDVIVEQAKESLMQKLSVFIPFFKVVSIVIVVYLIYIMFSFYARWKMRLRIKGIEKKVDLILEKLSINEDVESLRKGLDKKRKSKKKKKETKKKKSKSFWERFSLRR
jgi:hypothetical protein